MNTAYYVEHDKRHFLVISDGTQPLWRAPQFEITGKSEAKAQAKAHNARPLNF